MDTQKKELPLILYGQMQLNGKTKIGSFHYGYNKWSNKMEYLYYTPKGNKGTGGFTIQRALQLMEQGILSTDPNYGTNEFYV